MKSMRKILFQLGAVAILAVIAAVMLMIGRGHTVYFDNVTTEYSGTEYKAPHKVEVYVKGERAAKLNARERGMATWIGQNFSMQLIVTKEKGGSEETIDIDLKLPYNMDGIIVNLPAYLAGLPEEAWLSEFIPAVVEEEPEEPAGGEDEFGLTDELGDGLGDELGDDLGL